MSNSMLVLNDDGGTETGLLTFDGGRCEFVVSIPKTSPFHSPQAKIFTDSNFVSISPCKPYSKNEDYQFLVKVEKPGFFLISCENGNVDSQPTYFLVNPIIDINGKKLNPAEMVIQTNAASCLGPLSEWMKSLEHVSQQGFNMINLIPTPEILDYSISADPKKKKMWDNFVETIKTVEKKLNVGFMANVILNRTAKDTDWILDMPECGYTEETAPYLIDAMIVDDVIYDTVSNLKCSVDDFAGISNQIVEALRNSDLKDRYVYDIEECVSKLRDYKLADLPEELKDLHEKASNFNREQRVKIIREKAFKGKSINIDIIAALYLHEVNIEVIEEVHEEETKEENNEEEINEEETKEENNEEEETKKENNEEETKEENNEEETKEENNEEDKKENVKEITEEEEDKKEIVEEEEEKNEVIEEEVKEEKKVIVVDEISEDNINEIIDILNKENEPFWAYFNDLCREISQNEANYILYHKDKPTRKYFTIINANGKDLHYACDGYVPGTRQATDFADKKHSPAYLKRTLTVTSDYIKLRFGLCPEDNKRLWNFGERLVKSISKTFHAFRLENLQKTSPFVVKHFIEVARESNPNIYITAELFSNGETDDINNIKRYGLNSLLKEGSNYSNPFEVANLILHSSYCQNIKYYGTNLHSVRYAPTIVFDITQSAPFPSAEFERLSYISPFSMSNSPIASTRGIDDLLAENPGYSTEKTTYSVNPEPLKNVRKIFAELHSKLAKDYKMMLVEVHDDVLSILRFNETDHDGVWMMIKFGNQFVKSKEIPILLPISSLRFEMQLTDVVFSEGMKPGTCKVMLNEDESKFTKIHNNVVDVSEMPEDTVVCYNVAFNEETKTLISEINSDKVTSAINIHISQLTIPDLNMVLYRSEAEERLATSHGSYYFDSYGGCFYSGIEGIWRAFKDAYDSNDGIYHPVFTNVRNGDWLMDYISHHILQDPHLIRMSHYFKKLFEKMKKLPRILIPTYLFKVIDTTRNLARKRIFSLMTDFVVNGDELVQNLAALTVAFYGKCSNAPLVNKALVKDMPFISNPECSLAAGLPHFATGFMRSWGRDTFIALRGIFLVTGRFVEARDHLLAFASCLRHGLIPNLQDACLNPRYNARDATWFFLQACQEYFMTSPDGNDIFNFPVTRLFPSDTKETTKYSNAKMLDIIVEILQKHAMGIHYVEWNAGSQIDDCMTEKGFNVDIETNWENGFIYGGNTSNCGTWMDKMGSSFKAENRGFPATPRNGADIEIIGLLASTLRWLDECYHKHLISVDGVYTKDGKRITWNKWHTLIKDNFEKYFYIPTKEEDDVNYTINKEFIKVRGIYKDTVGAEEDRDYQFRPNLLIAMTVAPELFDAIHAVSCINLVEERLCGYIGMKTLDEEDPMYRPFYVNGVESTDFWTSNGFSYHNGPEWVWLTGYLFRAALRFRMGITERMQVMIDNIKATMKTRRSNGLPELTNANGGECYESCPLQAWSVSCILESLYDMSLFREEDKIDWSQYQ